MGNQIDDIVKLTATPWQLKCIEAYNKTGSYGLAASVLGVSRERVSGAVSKARKAATAAPPSAPPKSKLSLHAPRPQHDGRVFLVTSAQNDTVLEEALWENLLAYSEYRQARVIVGRFIYRKDALGQRGQEKKHKRKNEARESWDRRLLPYVLDERTTLAPGLVWCGEMNILPTATDPIAGLQSYSKQDSCIFPHPKLAMESVATPAKVEAKLIYTTGAVTRPNYIQRKAGLKAEFDHVIGALIVEWDGEDWFVRQLNATKDGSFQDLDIKVANGRVTSGHPVAAINWFDIHVQKMSKSTGEACWGEGGIIDELRPATQTFDDLHDHESRNHHDRASPSRNYQKHVLGLDDVHAELRGDAEFIRRAHRQFCSSYVICSNHDQALDRWLEETKPSDDPKNAMLWLEATTAKYKAIDAGIKFNSLQWALERDGIPPTSFLTEDDRLPIAGEIEAAQHGHRGPNGTKGGPRAFARLGLKMKLNHVHSASIQGGVYTNGVSEMDMGYNKGFSSWSRTFTVTYSSAKRTLVTMRGTKWRAAV